MKKVNKSLIFILIIFSIVLIDQILKYLIKNKFINISHITNTGSLFGLFKGANTILIIFSIIVIIGFFLNWSKIKKLNVWFSISCGLIVGGAIGNLIDRIVYGAVIDFIDLGWWPLFNLADSAISTGIGLLIILILIEDKKSKIKS